MDVHARHQSPEHRGKSGEQHKNGDTRNEGYKNAAGSVLYEPRRPEPLERHATE
jgi:hypothetical protein